MNKKLDLSDKGVSFTRRAFALGAGKMALASLVLGRLYYLGAVRSSHYKTLANENRIRVRVLIPKRGLIYDRQGRLLADNIPCYRLMFVRDQSQGQVRRVLEKLARIVDLHQGTIDDLYHKIQEVPPYQPVVLGPLHTWEEVCAVEVNAFDLPGVYVEEGYKRFYPHGFATAHVIGYVQSPSPKDDLKKSYLHCPDFRLGREGIEKTYDLDLRGTAGYQEVEVNALRKVIRQLSGVKSQAGAPLSLTLDLGLQQFILKKIQDQESASVVVMDVHTGHILGLVSNPTFDPNLFNEGIPAQEWRTLKENPYGILNNKSIKGVYPPGSLFKMMVALAGLEAGIIQKKETIFCPGHLDFKGHRYHCWSHRSGHGSLDVVQALAASCDVYFYVQSQKIGIDRIAAMAQRFGFGDTTGIELSSEKKGLVPTRTWKHQTQGRLWTPADTLLTSIGQGPVLATPVQLAVMIARLVNGGAPVVPRLVSSSSSSSRENADNLGGVRESRGPFSRFSLLGPWSQKECPVSLGVQPQHLDVIKEGMDQVVTHPQGTAYAHRVGDPSLEMGGKTATSQVRRISLKEREKGVLKNTLLEWKQRDHALFVGYAPHHRPKYCVAVVVEHGGGGGQVAAPLARDILLQAQRLKI